MTSRADNDDWVLHRLEDLEKALEQVRADLERTWEGSVLVEAVINESDYPMVLVNGSGSSGGIDLAGPRHQLVAEVADYVQSQLMDQYVTRFWPACREHDRGLHSAVRDDVAVWWCRGGEHVVSGIGGLDPTLIV
ncbi:hypothetical protein [Aquihabitans sp. McL0605]|uniref:hypothetical protein n=1 Tax=Aquihabitans sp. McL0605 TaxID=3415671 RepID=UPI003CF36650